MIDQKKIVLNSSSFCLDSIFLTINFSLISTRSKHALAASGLPLGKSFFSLIFLFDKEAVQIQIKEVISNVSSCAENYASAIPIRANSVFSFLYFTVLLDPQNQKKIKNVHENITFWQDPTFKSPNKVFSDFKTPGY